MRRYVEPKVEFVELENANVVTESMGCDDYECPETYGSTCTGLPYPGT